MPKSKFKQFSHYCKKCDMTTSYVAEKDQGFGCLNCSSKLKPSEWNTAKQIKDRLYNIALDKINKSAYPSKLIEIDQQEDNLTQ